ncbi:50S ribosomal protein L25/general stress protein Ctc [Thalassotalea sp. 1_MG-2023]|uniref:50S ribosomal protein L25/general stress protein Ctc n=1 Tax=Thalassotalea sp. 1_MG-2023 TaxID=3062680 RepID=UPI0026E234BA|nr:50S ribosomal protein L25/general stress protein Ctc [Thalassotalea sp. 1_MG-2023]MDO6427961.1 50S ribosomal protein L25/general stress protein Ctc [Thalassotalea sp. 1_MG-2023]
MTDIFTLDAEVRTDLGKGASRRLRHANKVPAILYGEGKEPVSLTLAHNKVFRAQQEEAFYSQVLTLNVDGKPVECLVKDMQRHPFKQIIMHLDFMRVDAAHPIHTNVPIHFLNEEAVTKSGGIVAHNITEIAVTCLPGDLPEFIEVDVAGLEVGQTLHLSDVTLPKGVTSDELSKGEDHDQAVVTANAPKGGSSDDEEAEEETTEE